MYYVLIRVFFLWSVPVCTLDAKSIIQGHGFWERVSHLIYYLLFWAPIFAEGLLHNKKNKKKTPF